MAVLEIRSPGKKSLTRPLSPSRPLSIGRSKSCDIRLQGESIAPVHCRIGWNGSAYEVASGTPDGVDVNGTIVAKRRLKSGDVIRLGKLEFVLQQADDGSDEIAVAGAADEAEDLEEFEEYEEVSPAIADGSKNLIDDDWAALAGGAAVAAEAKSKDPEVSQAPATPPEPTEQPVLLDEPAAEKPKKSPAQPTAGWIGSKKRPGEQDIFSSPLVLGLSGLALVLLLAAGVIWFLIGREQSNRLYTAAMADRDAGKYSQAIRELEEFIITYPTDERVNEARYALGTSRIARYTAGATPDWSKALEEIEGFVRDNRDASDFASQKSTLRDFARSIAAGAAADASRSGDRKFLPLAEQGRKLFDRYAAGDTAADAVRRQLVSAGRAAEAAVVKQELFDQSVSTIETAIAANEFNTAFVARENLLTRYPDLRTDKRMTALLDKTLRTEQSLVKSDDAADLRAATEKLSGENVDRGTASIVSVSRARAGEVSDGRLVYAVARQMLAGLDAVTGQPRWRRVIGLDTPFFPMEITAASPSLLAFDAGRNELALIKREDGSPIWRSAPGAPVAGPPLVAQGQIDLALDGGRLARFDLESGQAVASVRFPQPILGPPVRLAEAERLFIFGHQGTVYTLDFRTLEILGVSYIGYRPGSVAAPAQTAGRLIVFCENDRLDSCLIRALAYDPKTERLSEAASERIAGQVNRPAVVRGNLAFVPTVPEGVTAFALSDDVGQPPLTRLAGTKFADAEEVPTYLVAGPDNELWAAGSALRKLRLAADGLKVSADVTAPGRHVQPPQSLGESLFVARTLPFSRGVFVSQADRQAMAGSWRTVLGGSVIAFAHRNGEATVATGAGTAAAIAAKDVQPDDGSSQFLEAALLPGFEEDATAPPQGTTLHDGRGVVWRATDPPLLWILEPNGRPGSPQTVPAAPQTAPVALGVGLILPLPGRLEVLTGGRGKVDAFLLPVDSGAAAGAETATAWQSVVRLDDERLAALDTTGRLRVIVSRTEPVPHLAEIAALDLPADAVTHLAALGDRLLVASGQTLVLYDAAGLRPTADVSFAAPLTGELFTAGDWAFVETAPGRVAVLRGEKLTRSGELNLGASVAAALAAANASPESAAGGFLIASQEGQIIFADAEGQETGRLDLQQPLTGLQRLGNVTLAIALDGTLIPLPSDMAKLSADETVTDTAITGEGR